MGKWGDRLESLEFSNAPIGGTDKTDISPLLAVMAVGVGGTFQNFEPPARPYRLTLDQADRAHAVAWTEVEILRFRHRQFRLQRLKFSPADAEDLAERLHLRDIDDDDRVACIECRHLRRGCCYRDETAQIHSETLPVAFTATLQRCRGFSEAD